MANNRYTEETSMTVTVVVDLVSDGSDDDEEVQNVGAAEISTQQQSSSKGGGKRKIEESKKEPNRKNPWFRNSSSSQDLLESKIITYAQRVSPGLEEQDEEDDDDDDEVVVVEQPAKLMDTKPSACSVQKTGKNAVQAPVASVATAAAKASLSGTSSSTSPPPPKIWWDSDNAIITYEVLSSLRAISNNNNNNHLLLSNVTTVPHIEQMDRWSCGFRNIQMLLSGLVPLLPATHPYFASMMHIYAQEVPDHILLDSSSNAAVLILPSLTQLQQQLEACWREGFDPHGADHFKHSVVGRPSKIGAVEVGFLLGYWWLDACVVQFIKCFQSRRLLPAFVYHYFRGCSTTSQQQAFLKAIECLECADEGIGVAANSGTLQGATTTTGTSTVLPLYLQWEGHSVTVVGIEPPAAGDIGKASWSQWNLLVFCPGRNCSKVMSSGNTNVAPFRLSCRQLLQKDCQLVLSSWEPLTPKERQERKNVASFVVTAAQDAVTEYANRGVLY